MFESVAKIITAVGNNPRKMLVMSILLFFISGVTITSKVLTKSDCSPLIKENAQLVKDQGELVKSNSELLSDYLKIQKLLTHFKPDTVYVTKSVTTIPTMNDIQILTRVNAEYSDNSDSLKVAAKQNEEIRAVIPTKIKMTQVYKKSNDSVMKQLNSIIESHLKKDN